MEILKKIFAEFGVSAFATIVALSILALVVFLDYLLNKKRADSQEKKAGADEGMARFIRELPKWSHKKIRLAPDLRKKLPPRKNM